MEIVNNIKQIGYDRCGKCPAFWSSVDHWGEGDAGCQLHNDVNEFCKLSLLPKFVVNHLVKHEEKKQDKHWTELGDAMAAEEYEVERFKNALLKTLDAHKLEICWDGKKVDLDWPFFYELRKEFKG